MRVDTSSPKVTRKDYLDEIGDVINSVHDEINDRFEEQLDRVADLATVPIGGPGLEDLPLLIMEQLYFYRHGVDLMKGGFTKYGITVFPKNKDIFVKFEGIKGEYGLDLSHLTKKYTPIVEEALYEFADAKAQVAALVVIDELKQYGVKKVKKPRLGSVVTSYSREILNDVWFAYLRKGTDLIGLLDDLEVVNSIWFPSVHLDFQYELKKNGKYELLYPKPLRDFYDSIPVMVKLALEEQGLI